MRCKEEFLINPVCESSAIYCQHWANQAARKEKPRQRVGDEVQTAAMAQVLNAGIQEAVVTERRRKRGRKALGKIAARKRMVRKHIKRKSDFSDPEIFHGAIIV